MKQSDRVAGFRIGDHRHLRGRVYPHLIAFEFNRHFTWCSSHVHLLDESKIRTERGGGDEQEEKADSFHRRVLLATPGIGKSRCHGKSTWQEHASTAFWAALTRV
jgi:hypothetical protein